MQKINVCVPVIGLQSSKWYVPIMDRIIKWQKLDGFEVDFVIEGPTFTNEEMLLRILTPESAIPSVSKNIGMDAVMKDPYVSQNGTNDTLTSHNRNRLVDRADGEWIFFIDYDTVPPADALPRLLSLRHPFCGGVYYHRNVPHMPLLYWRNPETGLYGVIADYEKGALIHVDATGMGCTLIHRQVFEDIKTHYRQFSRVDGSRMLIHEDDIVQERMPSRLRRENYIIETERGWWHVQQVNPTSAEIVDNKPYPFFEMEHERTEDMGFCERAKRVGYDIVVDTSIECEHWHFMPITGQMFRDVKDDAKIRGELPQTIGEGLHGKHS